MLNSKQRSYLRGLANKIDPIFQVGKGGIEDAFLAQIEGALEARELVKIKTLNNSGITAREACQIICEEIKCDPVQVIGSKLVIYRKSEENPKIELPR